MKGAHVPKSYKRKVCQYCGREYLHWNGKSKYCDGPHYATCVVCGKKFEFDISKGRIPNCCSKQCTEKLKRQTCLNKYGTEVASKSVEVRKKLSESGYRSLDARKRTCLERYGCENPSSNPDIRRKISESVRSEDCANKTKRTMNERYGVDYAMQSKELFQKHAKASKAAVALYGTQFDSVEEQTDRLNEYRKLVSSSKKRKDSWIWMSNKSTGECRCVPPDTEKQFEQYGWVRGRLSFSKDMSNRVWITNGKSNARVHKKEVSKYLETGWRLGRSYKGTLGYKWVNNGTESKYVSSDEAVSLVSEGWAYGIVGRRKGDNTTGNKNKGCVHVYNPETGQSKMVPLEEANVLVSEGWKHGRGNFSMSDRTWMHNDTLKQNKRVKFEDVPVYEQQGWVRGQGRYNKK